MNRIVFANGNMVLPGAVRSGSLLVREGTIEAVLPAGQDSIPPDAQVIDCSGLYVGPGFVDIHVHGGRSHDFMGTDPDGLADGINYHFENGVTSLTPACISAPYERICKSIAALKSIRGKTMADVLGFHMEGVHLDSEMRGGHLAAHLHNPFPTEYGRILEEHGDFITEWTLAPELPGSFGLIDACTRRGIVTSVGHSRATYEELMRAMDLGLSHSTHFACVMGNLRFEALGKSTGKGFAPGVLETVLLDDRLTTEVIPDGYHLHEGLIRLAVKCKGPNRVCAVSDAMMGAGLPDGEYMIGDQACLVEHSLAIIKDRPQIIASSVTPMIGMFRNLAGKFGIGVHQAWAMCSLNPAAVIHREKSKGSLQPGKDADILVLDKKLAIRYIFAKGALFAPGKA